MEVPVRLDDTGVVPQYAHEHDAGCDLVAAEGATLPRAGGRAIVGTGMSVAIPEGYGGFVLPRSGLAARHGVTCANAPGLIDAGYRGEVKVSLVNLDPDNDYTVSVGDRIAQLVIMPVGRITFRIVDELPTAGRASGGFGSTGR